MVRAARTMSVLSLKTEYQEGTLTDLVVRDFLCVLVVTHSYLYTRLKWTASHVLYLTQHPHFGISRHKKTSPELWVQIIQRVCKDSESMATYVSFQKVLQCDFHWSRTTVFWPLPAAGAIPRTGQCVCLGGFSGKEVPSGCHHWKVCMPQPNT